MNADGPIVVVKVGGSLLDWPGLGPALRRFLDRRISRDDRPVLVVGGGGAADWVRDLDRIHGLGESAAHLLAIRSLDLTAHALARLVPGLEVAESAADLSPVWRSGLTPILAPRRMLDADDLSSSSAALPHSWDVTSDAISARLAVLLGAGELVLLKSVSVAPRVTPEEATRAGIVDRAFTEASRWVPSILVVNLRDDLAEGTRLTDRIDERVGPGPSGGETVPDTVFGSRAPPRN